MTGIKAQAATAGKWWPLQCLSSLDTGSLGLPVPGISQSAEKRYWETMAINENKLGN
jgi:hypothetical protein